MVVCVNYVQFRNYFQISTLKMLTLYVPHVLDLDSLDHHSPRLCAFIQNRLGGGKSEIVELLN